MAGPDAGPSVTPTASPAPATGEGCLGLPAYPEARAADVNDIKTPHIRQIVEGHAANAETVLWTTDDPYEQVDAFYIETMSQLGWHQWMEGSSPYTGGGNSWQLDDRGQTTVFVWTFTDEGQSVIAMVCITE